MTPRAPQAPRFRRTAWWKLAAVGLMALSTAGCLRKGAADITGSIPEPQQATPEIWRRQSDIWAPRFEANPADPMAAISYAQALRALDQRPQAVAVLQQAAIRNPQQSRAPRRLRQGARRCRALQGGRRGARPRPSPGAPGLAHPFGAGRRRRPDRRPRPCPAVLRGGPEARARTSRAVLSNLGLSYALDEDASPEAERVAAQAAANAQGADARVRQNLALVLGLQGSFAEAEAVLSTRSLGRRDRRHDGGSARPRRSRTAGRRSSRRTRKDDRSGCRCAHGRDERADQVLRGATSSPSPGSAPASG